LNLCTYCPQCRFIYAEGPKGPTPTGEEGGRCRSSKGVFRLATRKYGDGRFLVFEFRRCVQTAGAAEPRTSHAKVASESRLCNIGLHVDPRVHEQTANWAACRERRRERCHLCSVRMYGQNELLALINVGPHIDWTPHRTRTHKLHCKVTVRCVLFSLSGSAIIPGRRSRRWSLCR